ncbi:MAG: biotin/lipoyl-containing protein, partial [Spirochaetales bacterium]
QMMRDNNLMHRYPEVIAAMGEAVQKGGFGTSVTPVSQFYFQQAFNNVMFGPWKKIAEGYGKMVLGYFGKTPVEPDPEVVRISKEQLGLEPTTELVVDINDKDPKKGRKAAEAMLKEAGLPITDENVFIAATCREKGILFLQGKATIGVRKEAKKKEEHKEEAAKPKTPSLYTVTINGKPYVVSLKEDTAVVNGVNYAISVKEGGAPTHTTGAPAPTPTASAAPVTPAVATATGATVEIDAPLPGIILRVPKQVGEPVQEGEVVIVLESMKMETPIKAPASGTIAEMRVNQGAQVKTGQVLAIIRQ